MTVKDRAQTTVVTSPEEMRAQIKTYFLETVKPLLQYNGIVSIGVSGGSMPKVICDVLKSIKRIDWDRIRLFMVDERVVPLDHEDSNYNQYIQNLPENLHHIVVPLQIGENISRTASQYETTLKQQVSPELMGGIPRFDFLFLGMGPDGHTCSLFPHHRLLKADLKPWVLYIEDSPKPPPKRVTISLHCINAAKNVAFIITGADKAEIVKGVLDRDTAYPASLVKPHNSQLRFFLDEAAASKL